ncbi:MAG TPA: hypothetical protein VF377_10320 [Acidimicrobiia bacterium]
MSETARELLVWEEFVASDGYVFGSGVRSATEDEVRAAVVPLLDLEAAAIRYYEGDEIRPKPPYWSDCTDAMKDWYRHESKRVVYAALGLGEEP